MFTIRKHLGTSGLKFSLKPRRMKPCLQYDVKQGEKNQIFQILIPNTDAGGQN